MTRDIVATILAEALQEGVFTAAACSVSRAGSPQPERQTWFAGEAEPNTLFDLASLTKPMCTAVLLLRLCELGRLALTDPVSDWLPECRHLGNCTVFHLATHTGGLPAWKPLFEEPDPLGACFRTPLDRLPGMGYQYSDLSYILLGVILERAGGEDLATLAREHVLDALRMSHTRFLPDQKELCAPTSNCEWRKSEVLRGSPHDANAAALGGIAGHAGLFAPLSDVATFVEALLPNPPRTPLHSKGAMESFLRNRIEGLGHQSVGFFTHGNPLLPDAEMFGSTAVGHSGFTGTAILVNPDRGPAVTLLTNRIYCDPQGDRYRRFRRRLIGALAASSGPVAP